MNKKIVVIGGTGTIGGTVVELLEENNADFKVVVRSDEKASSFKDKGIETEIGSLGEDLSEEILKGADSIFLLTSPSPMLFDQHKRLIDQAVKAGVRKIVRLSALPAETNPEVPMYAPHKQSDDYLMASGLEYVIL